MTKKEAPLFTLRDLLADVPQVGRLEWIGLRPERRAPLVVVEEARLVEGRGLEGDRYKKKNGKRQVSLIQKEHFDVMRALLDVPVEPEILRRNLVLSGIPVAALRRTRFSIGSAVLEGTDRCAPCSRMREALGPGGYAAMIDMGGVLARVLEGGTIKLGDEVRVLGLSSAYKDKSKDDG